MNPKVLVVDDETETLTLLAYVLRAEGFEVMTAVNGDEALVKASKVRPDAVLLDIQLPDMDGFAVCELLRALFSPADLPVILFSNHGGISVRARGLEAGSRQCLKKSDGLDGVVRSLRQAVEERTTSSAKGGKRTGDRLRSPGDLIGGSTQVADSPEAPGVSGV
jgi:DNA-binding response OmpR family regulator